MNAGKPNYMLLLKYILCINIKSALDHQTKFLIINSKTEDKKKQMTL